jgi:hypothetical protein
MKYGPQSNARLCVALGLDPNLVQDIRITISGQAPARVTAFMLLDDAATERLRLVVKDYLLVEEPAPGEISG